MSTKTTLLNPYIDAIKQDLYIVTGDEIPFVQDGTSDGESIRHWMHQLFISSLKKAKLP